MILMWKESYELLHGVRVYIDAIGQAWVKLYSQFFTFLGRRKRNLSLSKSRAQTKREYLLRLFLQSAAPQRCWLSIEDLCKVLLRTNAAISERQI